MNTSASPTSKDKLLRNILTLLCILLTTSVCFSQYGHLTLELSGIRSSKGNILVALYNQSDQWTDDPIRELVINKVNLQNNALVAVIDSIDYGTYAIALMDDENLDSKMSYFMGIPKEGFGMSRNPSFLKLKKPSFDEVCFHVNKAECKQAIQLNYLYNKPKQKKNIP